jgi:hypothetical protein
MEYFKTKEFPNINDIFHGFFSYLSQFVPIITYVELLTSNIKSRVPRDSDSDRIEEQIIQGNTNKK